MKWRHVVMAAVVALFVCEAAGGQEIVTFADPNLEAAVRERLGVTEPDPVTSNDMLGLYSLSVDDRGIFDLSGLEYASHLEGLLAYVNQITRLDPLRRLSGLTDLHLQGNLLTDISPLSGLTNLRHLVLGRNALSQVGALSDMANLTDLALDDNDIADIGGLEGLRQLRILDLTRNRVDDVSGLAGLWDLQVLWLGENQISDISALAGLSDLAALSLEQNRVPDISPLGGLTELRYLDLRGNPLDQAAYDTYLPLIEANNPGIDLRYDPIPEPGSLVLVSLAALALAVRSRGAHGVWLGSSGRAEP